MFRAIILPIFRSTRLYVTACGIMHPRCCRPATQEFFCCVSRGTVGPTQSHMQRTVILSLGEGGREREAENSVDTSVTWCGTLPPPHGNRNRLHVQFQVKSLLTLRQWIEIGACTLHIYRDFTHSLLRRSKYIKRKQQRSTKPRMYKSVS